ncbi:MAG: Citrate synthase [Syntrophus sp. SKADARSKE-3]|nr:Citrate synthase [Syntrophus sp. SKADARSKE-3]
MKEHKYAELKIEGRAPIRLRAIQGTEGGLAIDVSELYKNWGILTCDPGYMSTGSCYSEISYIDGEKGILRYRGYNIYDLAMKNVDFVETAWLLIHGNLPNQTERRYFRELLTNQEILHEGMLKFFDSLPPYGDPMPILSAAVQCSSLYHPELRAIDPKDTDAFMMAAAKLISKVRTIAAFSYKKTIGMPFEYPDPALDYCSNFLHMMYSLPYKRYGAPPIVIEALNLFLMLHADHEQNCSTSTVRMVGSSQANLFDSVSAGISALSGRLHGGANREVIHMLKDIHAGQMTVSELIASAKKKTGSKLHGFGHRIYKTYDPRASVLKRCVDQLLKELNTRDPLLEIAKEVEGMALEDDYFREKGLYPNIDFYSGILLRTIGIEENMFTVMFAIARMAGWIAHWREGALQKNARIQRPRQIYIGMQERPIPEKRVLKTC